MYFKLNRKEILVISIFNESIDFIELYNYPDDIMNNPHKYLYENGFILNPDYIEPELPKIIEEI